MEKVVAPYLDNNQVKSVGMKGAGQSRLHCSSGFSNPVRLIESSTVMM